MSNAAHKIIISMDNIWAGSGDLVDGQIVNCGAQFCDDIDESDVVYSMIEDRLDDEIVDGEMTIDIDGQDRKISWHLEPCC